MTTEKLKPKYRYQLRAKISEAGFRTITQYSKVCGLNISQVSKVVSGRELPTPRVSYSMANKLGVSVEEFAGFFE